MGGHIREEPSTRYASVTELGRQNEMISARGESLLSITEWAMGLLAFGLRGKTSATDRLEGSLTASAVPSNLPEYRQWLTSSRCQANWTATADTPDVLQTADMLSSLLRRPPHHGEGRTRCAAAHRCVDAIAAAAVVTMVATVVWTRWRLKTGNSHLASVRAALEDVGDGKEVPVFNSVEEAVEHHQVSGSFAGCIWGRTEGAVCARRTDWIVETTGRIFTPTISWMPACDAHARDLGHWASTGLMWRGSFQLIKPEELLERTQYRHRTGGVTTLMVLPGVTTEEQLRASAATDLATDPAFRQHTLDLPVHVGRRTFNRTVRAATPLSANVNQGAAAEVATYGAAALWGVADFVFKAAPQIKGRGVREVGDSLIVLQHVGVVVQVKRRPAATTSPDRETNWIHKAVVKAEKQALGSIRTLQTEKVPAVSGRGEVVTFEPDHRRWISVIIIDHDHIPQNLAPQLDSKSVVVMSRRDWEFLFSQLKSTHAVVNYLLMILEDNIETRCLDAETGRYMELAELRPPSWMPPTAEEGRYYTDGRTQAGNNFPLSEDSVDLEALTFYRSIIEDAAIYPTDWITRYTILNLLDSLPMHPRVMLARDILKLMKRVRRWHVRFRRLPLAFSRLRISPEYPQFAVSVSGRDLKIFQALYHRFAVYEHHKMLAVDGFKVPLTTIGLGIVAQPHEPEGWQTSLGILSHTDPLTGNQFEELRLAFGPQWDDIQS